MMAKSMGRKVGFCVRPLVGAEINSSSNNDSCLLMMHFLCFPITEVDFPSAMTSSPRLHERERMFMYGHSFSAGRNSTSKTGMHPFLTTKPKGSC